MTFPSPFYRWRPHPWHGLSVGQDPPGVVHAYIEITPFDSVKYEIDKETGYLRVDRPQQTSSQPPTLYGFIPRTFCGSRVGALTEPKMPGDGDPLDICVVSERPINRSEVLLHARVIGGLQMVDGGEADDKIIAVLDNDPFFTGVEDLTQIPEILVERLRHYFNTYKMVPNAESEFAIRGTYGASHANAVVTAAIEDYEDAFGS